MGFVFSCIFLFQKKKKHSRNIFGLLENIGCEEWKIFDCLFFFFFCMQNFMHIILLCLLFSLVYGKDLSFLPSQDVLGDEFGLPVGAVMIWTDENAKPDPNIWIECDGREVDPVKFPKLYAIASHTPNYVDFYLRGGTKNNVGTQMEAGEADKYYHNLHAKVVCKLNAMPNVSKTDFSFQITKKDNNIGKIGHGITVGAANCQFYNLFMIDLPIDKISLDKKTMYYNPQTLGYSINFEHLWIKQTDNSFSILFPLIINDEDPGNSSTKTFVSKEFGRGISEIYFPFYKNTFIKDNVYPENDLYTISYIKNGAETNNVRHISVQYYIKGV